MAAFATATFQDNLSGKKIRIYRLQPSEKLIRILWVFLGKMRPLPAEILCGFGLVVFYLF
jgi:hypothetical protein